MKRIHSLSYLLALVVSAKAHSLFSALAREIYKRVIATPQTDMLGRRGILRAQTVLSTI
jgi:hypothetical protein